MVLSSAANDVVLSSAAHAATHHAAHGTPHGPAANAASHGCQLLMASHSLYHSLCRTHHAEQSSSIQEHTHKAKAEEQQQQQQQQQRGKLREECSVGMMPGHFVMLSKQWGPVVNLLQGQRNKRKASQAFHDVPLTGEPSHTFLP